MASTAERLAGPALAVLAGCVYLATAPRWILGGDNGEFAALLARGGVAHPPGYPLYVLLLRSLRWVPAASPAHAGALITAIVGAATVLVLHRAAMAWGASAGAATIAVAAFASSSLAWRMATEAEVFALNACIAASIVLVTGADGRVVGVRRAAGLGLLGGLGLANHLSVVWLAPLGVWGVYRAAREASALRAAVACLLGAGVGLLPYVYLFVSARHADPATQWVWGDIHDLPTLLAHVRRAEFGTTRLALHDAPLEPWLQVETLALRLGRDLLLLPLVAVVVGALSVRRARADVTALVAATLLAGPVFVSLFNIAPRGVSARIVERFYLLPAALTTVLVALSLTRWKARGTNRTLQWGALSAGVLGTGFLLASARVAEGHRPTVELYVKNTLASAPPRAILLGSGDQKVAGMLYGQLVLGLRPDVTFLAPALLPASWYRARASQAVGADLVTDRVGLVRALLATGRPVAFLGPPPAAVLGSLTTAPRGTLFSVSVGDDADLVGLWRENLALLARFELEDTVPTSPDSWAGVTLREYSFGWLALENAFRRAGDDARAEKCRELATRLSPAL